MSRVSKGKTYERLARKLLASQGFLCETKNYSRFQGQDFYNLFDILAIGKYTRLIQVKTNPTHFYKARKDIREWLNINDIRGVSFEVWLKEPRKEWRVEIILPDDNV